MPELTTRAAKGSALTHAELDANFKRTVTQKTTTYACLVSDNRSVIEGNHASTPFTITLGDATTMVAGDTGDYEVTITNVGAAVVTVARAGSDTIDGAATSLTLNQYDTVTLQVNSAGDGYLSTAGKIPGLTSTVAELNTLDGYTGSVTELNYLDALHDTGVTDTEFDYLDGVISNIQTQLDAKADTETVLSNHVRAGNTQLVTGDAITDNQISIATGVTEAVWTEITSTEWGVLSIIPSSATILLVDMYLSVTTNSSSTASVNIYVREASSSAGISTANNKIGYIDCYDGSSTGRTTVKQRTMIPYDGTSFDIYWTDAFSSSTSIVLEYRGFITD